MAVAVVSTVAVVDSSPPAHAATENTDATRSTLRARVNAPDARAAPDAPYACDERALFIAEVDVFTDSMDMGSMEFIDHPPVAEPGSKAAIRREPHPWLGLHPHRQARTR